MWIWFTFILSLLFDELRASGEDLEAVRISAPITDHGLRMMTEMLEKMTKKAAFYEGVNSTLREALERLSDDAEARSKTELKNE